MKYLIEILLPLSDNDGVPFPEDFLRRIQTELTDRFGGVTAHGRAPATGIWRRGNHAQSADIVIVEVMTDKLEPDWWRGFRHRLERLLRQDKVMIRAQEIREL